MPGYFRLRQISSGAFVFDFRAEGGVPLATSPSFTSLARTEDAVERVRSLVKAEDSFHVVDEPEGARFFVMHDPDGREVIRSRRFESRESCADAIRMLQTGASDAPLTDEFE